MIEDFYLVAPDKSQSTEAVSKKTNKQNIQLAYWSSVKDSRNPALFAAYLKRYPDGIFADLAKIKISFLNKHNTSKKQNSSAENGRAAKPKIVAKLKISSGIEEAPTSTKEPSVTPNNGSTKEKPQVVARVEPETINNNSNSDENLNNEPALGSPPSSVVIREIQQQLNRLECPVGRPDGKWGFRSRKALKRANIALGIETASLEPSHLLLKKLSAQTSRLCLPNCNARQVLRNGQCVKKSCASGLKLSNTGQCYKSSRTSKACRTGYHKNSRGKCIRLKTRRKTVRRKKHSGGASGCFVFNGRRVCQ